MKKIKNHISSINTIYSEEWEKIMNMGKERRLKKEENLVQQDSIFNKEVFIKEGIMRAYILDDDGNEKSIAFFQEGEFMSTSTLRTKNGRSIHHYQAMCKTNLLLFEPKELRTFLSKNNALSAIGKAIKENEIERINNRDKCLLQVKARNKYLSFLKYYPNLEMYISQKHIASYLGITPVSLSRIKSGQRNSKTDNN